MCGRAGGLAVAAVDQRHGTTAVAPERTGDGHVAVGQRAGLQADVVAGLRHRACHGIESAAGLVARRLRRARLGRVDIGGGADQAVASTHRTGRTGCATAPGGGPLASIPARAAHQVVAVLEHIDGARQVGRPGAGIGGHASVGTETASGIRVVEAADIVGTVGAHQAVAGADLAAGLAIGQVASAAFDPAHRALAAGADCSTAAPVRAEHDGVGVQAAIVHGTHAPETATAHAVVGAAADQTVGDRYHAGGTGGRAPAHRARIDCARAVPGRAIDGITAARQFEDTA